MFFFTADWHFSHENILTLGPGRPFDSIAEHDAELVRRHNSLVGPADTVWVLGDVAMGRIEDSLKLCAQMNGRKILICGNHDRPAMTSDEGRRDRWVRRYLDEGGFDQVIVPMTGRTIVFELSVGDVGMSHYPYRGDSQEADRYADRRPEDRGGWLLHGHVHHAWRQRDRMINVGVDMWDYYPVSVGAVEDLIRAGAAYAPRSGSATR